MQDDAVFRSNHEAGGHLSQPVGGTRYENTCHGFLLET
jgi:hypothetical protein